MNYYIGVSFFINYVLSNPRNISEGSIRCPCKKCKNKNFLDPDLPNLTKLLLEYTKSHSYHFSNKDIEMRSLG